MSWERWEQRGERALKAPILRETFYIFSITLLSLLLPLSFLLLTRLSNAQYLLSLTPSLPHHASSVLSFFLYTNPTLLQILIAIVGIATLFHTLTGRTIPLNEYMKAIPQPRLYTSWILLCTLQVCVGLGIEGTIACGIWTEDYGVITNDNYLYVSRVIFFIGLHEMMLHWSRTFVRPVVDDTVMGGILRKERWFERAMMGVSFGLLWWWRLKKEVDGLLVVMEVKREAIMLGLSITDIINWWLYYLTVLVGNVRIVKGVIWIGKVMLLRRQERSHCSCTCRDNDIDDKV